MHPDDQKFNLGFFGDGRIVEHFGEVFQGLLGEAEADHFGAPYHASSTAETPVQLLKDKILPACKIDEKKISRACYFPRARRRWRRCGRAGAGCRCTQ